MTFRKTILCISDDLLLQLFSNKFTFFTQKNTSFNFFGAMLKKFNNFIFVDNSREKFYKN